MNVPNAVSLNAPPYATSDIEPERVLVLLVVAWSLHKARRTISVRLYRCISFFRACVLVDCEDVKRRYQLARANSQIGVA